MNINIDFDMIIKAAGFAVFVVVMWNSNRQGFKSLNEKIGGLSEKIDSEKENAILFVKEIRRRYAKEQAGIEASIDNLLISGMKIQHG